MEVDYLIVGQGISGTMVSWFLHKAGKSFLVIDNPKAPTASSIAAGVINPVTGRRYAYTWMIDELIEFALVTYGELGKLFDIPLITEKSIIDFFPSAQMRNAFIDRLNENDTFLHSYPSQNRFNEQFYYDFGCGEIKPAYVVYVQQLIELWKNKLTKESSIYFGDFEVNKIEIVDHGIKYKDINAERILFCDGINGASNPWFKLLPFAPNKGEMLLIEAEEVNQHHIFKKGLMLVPLNQNQYWVGSNYQWEFENDQPSENFLQSTTTHLKHWLKKPFKILSHQAAVRPATLERRPFVGFHPVYSQIGILNGMGTKGVSLAPFFASQLVQHLVYNFPISNEADIHRYSGILSKR
jgi:glycine/D-amino acid oxidase-like deaminating enzyme